MRRQIFAGIAIALVATACGSTIDKGNYADETRIASPAPGKQLKTCPAASVVSVTAATATNVKVKPKLVLKTAGCAGVTKLYTKDLVVGKGAVVKATDSIYANYVGLGWNSRKEFDSSWGGEPLNYPLAQLVKGWQQGVPGMRVGGRRLLVIPGELAYGSNPPPGGTIEINETLIFVMDMVDVNRPTPSPTPQAT